MDTERKDSDGKRVREENQKGEDIRRAWVNMKNKQDPNDTGSSLEGKIQS